ATVPVIGAAPVGPIIPRADLNHRSRVTPRSVIVVVVVRIVWRITIVSVGDADSDSNRDACFGLWRRGKGKRADGQADQKKFFPVHLNAPLSLMIVSTVIQTRSWQKLFGFSHVVGRISNHANILPDFFIANSF